MASIAKQDFCKEIFNLFMEGCPIAKSIYGKELPASITDEEIDKLVLKYYKGYI